MTTRKKPSTKQRLDRFDERMEAISRNLELVSLMQLETEKKLDRLAAFTLTNVVSQHKRIKKLEAAR